VVAVVVALIVFAAVAAAVWFLASSDSSSTSGTPTPAPGSATTAAGGNVVPGTPAEIVSVAKLRARADGVGHPVYWAGPRLGARIEFTQTTDGSTYVRYLTGSAKAGAKRPNYVVVATYAQPDAYTRATTTARERGYSITTLGDGSVAITKPGRLQNVYLVFPGRPYQVEVFTPRAAEAHRLVSSGSVLPVR
jgi:hypothetical protein